ncbi:hypothetical protein [Streptomyces sp. B1I3]|uniref:DUF6907 domain-containing protein n=1 Tax=Streptomyces sp. B1I3 TaxID=3042264 RepID=UPI0027893D19|nr:hypothetical protein [Streptomyces sp. B1I3]MDQ0795607.1 hypothetical protein [Streptomyces sp. B1I3]
MTSAAANSAANDNSARGATQALSVEQFETTAKQIGSSMTSIADSTRPGQANLNQPAPAARPTFAELGEAVAARIAAGVPSIAAELGQAGLASLLADVLRQLTRTARPAACPDWCVTDHTAGNDPGWHQGPSIDVTCSVPGLNAAPGGPLETLLCARVVQHNEDPDAFGVETRLWVDTGLDTTELDVAQTDQLIAGLETFLPKLRAMRGHLAEASAGDHPGTPAVKATRMADVDARVKAINKAEATRW